jgi:Domain of unknown function (DUF5618)
VLHSRTAFCGYRFVEHQAVTPELDYAFTFFALRQVVKPVATPRTKTEYLAEAKRKLANAKDILKPVLIEDNRYQDAKYVQTAAAVAYLAALEAVNAVAPVAGNHSREAESIEEYQDAVRKLKSQSRHMLNYLNTAYENLHILAYYRRGTSVSMVKDGLQAVKQMIAIAEDLPDPRTKLSTI